MALAPAIAALVALAGHAAWTRRETVTGRLACSALVLAGGLWSFVLLGRTSSWQPELRWIVLVLTLAAAAGLAVPFRSRLGAARPAGGGPGGGDYRHRVVRHRHRGQPRIPAASRAWARRRPLSRLGRRRIRGGGGAPTGTGAGSAQPGRHREERLGADGTARTDAPTGTPPGGTAKSGSTPTGSGPPAPRTTGSEPAERAVGHGAAGGTMPSGGGGATASTALTKALKATSTKWAAAVVGDKARPSSSWPPARPSSRSAAGAGPTPPRRWRSSSTTSRPAR